MQSGRVESRRIGCSFLRCRAYYFGAINLENDKKASFLPALTFDLAGAKKDRFACAF